MTSLRVFVSAVETTDEHQEAQVAVQLMKDLRDAGAEVIADDGTVPDEQFLPFLQQELPTCQWLVFIQTVESCRSLRAQAVMNMALQLSQQQALSAVLRIVCPSATTEQEPDAWSHTSAYAFRGDYPRLRAKVFLALDLSPRDDATRAQGWSSSFEVKKAALLRTAHQKRPTPLASPGQRQDDSASYDRPKPLSRGRFFASRRAHLREKQPGGEGVAQYDRPAPPAFMKYRRYRAIGITAGALAAGIVIVSVLATLLVSPKPPLHLFKARPAPSGPPSNTVQVTPSVRIPGAPTNLVAAAGNGEVMLSWTAPAPGLWYWIYWRDTSSGQTTYTRSTYPLTSGTSFTLTYLTNGHTYQFYITAINAGGEGPASNHVQATPFMPLPGSPSSLVAKAGNGQVTLSWTAPAPGLWYWIYWRDTSARQTAYTRSTYPLTSGTSFTLTYLTNGHTYQFYVTAINSGGEGPPSRSVLATPMLPLPAAPTGLSASANADGSIALSWTAPAPGLWYWIYWRDTSTGQTTYTRSTYPLTSGTSFTLSYLTNGHTYQFYVTAINLTGEGPASNVAQATSR